LPTPPPISRQSGIHPNAAVRTDARRQPFEAGVSVELVRTARHHGGDGSWGDLLVPVIVSKQALEAAE